MRNYAELVKDLRYCADLDKECLKCKTFEQHDCFNKLGADAADTIEELQAAVPKWISVEERLPEEHTMFWTLTGGRASGRVMTCS